MCVVAFLGCCSVCVWFYWVFCLPLNRHDHSDVELSAVSYLVERTLICNRTQGGFMSSFLQRISVLSAFVSDVTLCFVT